MSEPDIFGTPRAAVAADASLAMGSAVDLGTPRARTRYAVECRDAAGNLKWSESFDNIVVTAGLNKLIDATFKTGLTTPAWYVGLKAAGTVAAADTLASHAGWAESTPYAGNRPAFTPGTVAAGAVDNSASKAVFTMNATATVAGAFLCDAATGTAGTLYGAGDFGVSRSVVSGDSLSITVTPSVS